MEINVQTTSQSDRLTSRKNIAAHRIGGWVGPQSVRNFWSRKNICARIQAPNRQVLSVVILPNAAVKCLHMVWWWSDPFYPLGIQNCLLTTSVTKTVAIRWLLRMLWRLISGCHPSCAKMHTWEVISESGCATVSHSLGAGKALSAPVLRNSRYGGRVYDAE
jgi:hypothetical protein